MTNPLIHRLSTHQSVAYTATAGTITNVVGAQTYAVQVMVTTDAYVKIGPSPTATTSDVYLPAFWPHEFRIHPGEKVSAIRVASDGTLHVTELT